MGDIEIAGTIIQLQVVGIDGGGAGGFEGNIVERVGVSVRGQEGESVHGPLIQGHLQGIVKLEVARLFI